MKWLIHVLDEVNVKIPLTLSKIVQKLLSKNAEDRYQSAFGLEHDLKKCFEQWTEKAEIQEFTLAQNDYSGKFQIPQKLYGRDAERRKLLRTLKR